MTLVELYDETPIKNIVGALSLKPDCIFFVGPTHPMMDDLECVKTVLKHTLPHTKVDNRIVSLDDARNIRDTIETIIKDEQKHHRTCILETTGGNEIVLLIAHELAQKYDLQSQHYDILSKTSYDTDYDGNLMPSSPVKLSLKDILTLHHGEFISGVSKPKYNKKNINTLWKISLDKSFDWNKYIGMLLRLERHHREDLTVTMQEPANEKTKADFRIVRDKFAENNIIENLPAPDGMIRYRYLDRSTRHVLNKAGNILELKALYEAIDSELFDECWMGVKIHWNPEKVENEIDLILIRGAVPLFVSCKNGDVERESLYELDVVATHMGGEYVRKMLIATQLGNEDALVRRAKSEHIHLIKNAGELSSEQWKAEFEKALGLK